MAILNFKLRDDAQAPQRIKLQEYCHDPISGLDVLIFKGFRMNPFRHQPRRLQQRQQYFDKKYGTIRIEGVIGLTQGHVLLEARCFSHAGNPSFQFNLIVDIPNFVMTHDLWVTRLCLRPLPVFNQKRSLVQGIRFIDVREGKT